METLVNIWNTYKSDIIPILTTVITIMLPAIAVYLASRLRAKAAREEAQAEQINQIASREDTRGELDANAKAIEEMKEAIDALQEMVTNLADLFNGAFQASSLSPEIKEKLDNLTSRVKTGVSTETITSLKSEIDKYKDLYDNVVIELENAKNKITDKKTIKRVRV